MEEVRIQVALQNAQRDGDRDFFIRTGKRIRKAEPDGHEPEHSGDDNDQNKGAARRW